MTAAMTFTKNNLSKSDEEHACASKKEKRQRETDGVCCRVPSLWNLGYSSTAAGPACAHPVYLPCAGQRVNHLRGVNIQTAELYPPAVLLLRPGKTVLLITESTTFSKQLTVYKKKQKQKNCKNTVPGVHSFRFLVHVAVRKPNTGSSTLDFIALNFIFAKL